MYVDGGNATINNSCFTDNLAFRREHQDGTSNGGAINYAGSAPDDASFYLHVFNSIFLRNIASSLAGAIYSWQLPGIVYIVHCSSAQNGDHDLASDVYVFGSSQRVTKLIVLRSNFTGSRTVAGFASVYGNFLQCFGCQSSNFSSNFSNSMCGALHTFNVGGQCEGATYGDLFNRTSISENVTSDHAYIDYWLGNDANYVSSTDIRGCRFDNISQQAAVKLEGGLGSQVVVAQSTSVGITSAIALWTISCSNVGV